MLFLLLFLFIVPRLLLSSGAHKSIRDTRIHMSDGEVFFFFFYFSLFREEIFFDWFNCWLLPKEIDDEEFYYLFLVFCVRSLRCYTIGRSYSMLIAGHKNKLDERFRRWPGDERHRAQKIAPDT